MLALLAAVALLQVGALVTLHGRDPRRQVGRGSRPHRGSGSDRAAAVRRLEPRYLAASALVAVLTAIVVYKGYLVERFARDPFLGIFTAVGGAYLLSRYALALFYRAPRDQGVEPTIALVMPAFNEQDAIAASLRSLLVADYPVDKLQIVAINDGSTDDTLAQLMLVAGESGGRIRVINFAQNRGKRAAMAAGIRATSAEIIAFVDSDSILRHDALRKIVQPFAQDRVGAVCGHAEVLNASTNWLTKVQAVRYCANFRILKAAESYFGAVLCCSGCFAAYRREAVMPWLDWWEHQRFLGRCSTIGDDRSLTTCLLRDWQVVYHAGAISQTIVPATVHGYIRQQARWKRSWTRESVRVSSLIWRKHPAAAIATYFSIIMPLCSPFTAVRVVALDAPAGEVWVPLVFVGGVFATTLVMSLFYVVRTRSLDTVPIFGLAWVFVYIGLMLWLTYYAIATCRSSAWGTRASGSTDPAAETAVLVPASSTAPEPLLEAV